MRNRVIVTSVIGEKYQAIWKLTGPTVEAYADRIDADILVIEENPHETSPHWVKFALHEILHKRYKRAAWIDADIIIRGDAPDIFDVVPEDRLGIFNEGRFTPRSIAIHEAMQVYKIDLPDWDRVSYFNSGVMVISQDQRHLFNQPENIKKQKYNFGEQTYLNLRILQRKVPVHELSPNFNRMSLMDPITGTSRLASWFVHYAGYPSENRLDIIKNDLERWEKDEERGKYYYPPVIFINIGGGLGDQGCAEPVVRYIREKLYRDAVIYATSSYPELFSHIPGIFLSNETPKAKVDAVYRMDLHPDKDTGHTKFSLYMLSHPVDYISSVALKRILPVEDKQIRLPDPDTEKEPWEATIDPNTWPGAKNLVLVHPGKGWESKTFPVEWWDSVIEGLTVSGYRVGIIGKKINEEHGYLPVHVPPNGVDLRDKLSTMGLLRLLRSAPVLISNDSAPIHLAGAFDNNIILIPTCKHPEHLLPYRHGSIWYKAAALYKKLLCDDFGFRPTSTEMRSVTRLVRPIQEYLPDPREVIETTYNMIARDIIYHDPLSVKRKEEIHEYRTV